MFWSLRTEHLAAKMALIKPNPSIFSQWKRFNLLPLSNYLRASYSSQKASTNVDNVEVPKNVIKTHHTANLQENGAIFDKKPFKLTLEAGKNYSWCLCGKSKSQPICDGTHKNIFLKIKYRPIRFQVEKTGDYWLCNCKQTKNRPFCDGTHKQTHIQNAVK